MMQKMRRPLALFCALFMCVTMLSGIVLPELAETAMAVADTNYEVVDGQVTVATVSEDGTTITITINDGGTTDTTEDDTTVTLTVPDAYVGKDIYIPNERVYFYDPDWALADLGATDDGYFFYQYGDGDAWGNGKVYVLQWGVNAFGSVQNNAVTSVADGTELVAAGKYDGWADLTEILRHKTPTVGGNNNYYVMLAPGLMKYDTAFADAKSDTVSNTVTYTAATVDGETTTVADLTQADYTNVYFYGPQAGRTPSAGVVGDTTICNDRSVDTSREIVFANEFHLPLDAVYHMDGIAMNATDSAIEARIYMPDYTEANCVSGLYMTNFYSQMECDTRWVQLGTNDGANTVATVLHITDSYFYTAKENGTTSVNYQAAADILYKNVVFNIKMKNPDKNGKLRLTPTVYGDTAFLGDYRNDVHFEMDSCTFAGKQAQAFSGYYDAFNNSDALVYIHDSHFEGLTRLFFEKNDYGSRSYDIDLQVENNYFEMVEDIDQIYLATSKGADGVSGTDDDYTYEYSYFFNLTGGSSTIRNNTFVARTDYKHKDFTAASSADVSGNLFLDHDGNVRASAIDSTEAVNSDIYASDQFSGGIRELFTVQETIQDLLVTNASVQTVNTATATGNVIQGSVTVLPKDGVAYKTQNIFTFKDEDVKLLGVYSDADCTQLVSSFTKGFGTLYAKAQYKAGNTTATVLYTITEPTAYHVVDQSSVGTYTFNGTTYVSGENATFYTTIADAVTVAAASDVVLLMPGTYSDTTAIASSVALVGPQVWNTPSAGNAKDITAGKTVQNGRNLDPTTEALITGAVNPDPDYNVYVVVAGVAISNTTAWWMAAESSATTVQSISNITLVDCYADTANTSAGGLIAAYVSRNRTKAASNRSNDIAILIDGCYINTTTTKSVILNASTNYTKIKNSTLLQNSSGNVIYATPIIPQNMACKPLSAIFAIEDSFIENKAATYAMTYANGYWNDGVYESEHVKDGLQLILDGNTIYRSANKIFIRSMFTSADNNYFQFTNNYVTGNGTSSSNPIFTNYGAYDDVAGIFDALVEGNIIYDSSKEWTFDNDGTRYSTPADVSVNVDENYYGTTASESAIAAVAGSGFVKDAFTYYVDPDMTATNKDLALTDKNFASAEITNSSSFADWSMAVTMNVADGKTYTLADFVTEKGEVTKVEKVTTETVEEVETEVLTDLFAEEGATYTPENGDKLKVTFAYTNDSDFTYTNAWTVDVTTTEGAWADYGLAPDSELGYLDLTEPGSITDGVYFLAPDWLKFAHSTLEGAASECTDTVITDDMYTEIGTTEDDNVEEADTVLHLGEDFYAKMPTTGYVYKLKYAVSAGNQANSNPLIFGTVVLFPGTYSGKSSYSNAAGYKTDGAYYAVDTDTEGRTVKCVYSPTKYKSNSSNLPLAYGTTTYGNYITSATPQVRVLGPYAGVPVANTKDGTSVARGDYEAKYTKSAAYVMNSAIKATGTTITFDGIAATDAFYITTDAGSNASSMYKNEYNTAMNIKNCYFDGMESDYLLKVRGNQSTSNNSTLKTSTNMEVNIADTYISTSSNLGVFVTNSIHISDSVIKGTGNATAFSFDPLSNSENSDFKDVSYTCEDSYVDIGDASLFAMDGSATSSLSSSTRNGITFEIKNNTVADATALVDITANSDATENANMAAITDIIVTNNTVSGSGDLLTGYGSDYAMRKVNVASNSFKGFATSSAASFTGFADNADFTNNYYRNSDGDVISANVASGKVTDVALKKDLTAWASDYTITGTNAEFAATLPDVIDWTKAGTNVYTAMNNNAHYTATVSAFAAFDPVKNGFEFASDNVKVVSLTMADGSEFTSFVDENNEPIVNATYKLTAKHAVTEKTVVYYFTVIGDIEGTLLADTDLAGRTYWDPDVADLEDGIKVVRQLDITPEDDTITLVDVVFTVGTDVFATVKEVPYSSVSDTADGKIRDIYMFAKVYDGEAIYSASASDRTNSYNYYGVQAGVSAVVDTDGDNIPDAKNPARSTEYETVWNNIEDAFGYQSCATIDGIKITGQFFFVDGSGVSTDNSPRVSAQFKLLNCTSDETTPIKIDNGYSDSLINSQGNMPDYFTIQNNYLIISDESAAGAHVIGGTDTDTKQFAGLEVTNNYIRTPDHVLFADVAGGNNLPNEDRCPGNEIYNFSNNNLDSSLNIGHKATSTGGTLDLTISNNLFDNNGKELDYFISVTDTSYTSINSVNVENNTFNNDGKVDYAIKNTSTTIPDASNGNVFNGFTYNFGNAEHGTVPAIAYANGKDIPVIFSGENGVATMNGIAANYSNAEIKIANALTCQVTETDGTTGAVSATDIAQNGVYTFITNDNMFVKVTDSTGTVYYNALPITGNDPVTVTAELCSIDGTVVEGQTCTVTIYNDPFTVGIEASSKLVETSGTYTNYFEGSVAGTGTLKAEEILGKWQFTVVDYGMYYGMTKKNVTDDISKYEYKDTENAKARANSYVTDERTAVLFDEDGTVVGTKESYDNDYDNGLGRVYLNYSFNMNGADSGERWGRMYMTVQVGTATYTFYSDPVGLTNANTVG